MFLIFSSPPRSACLFPLLLHAPLLLSFSIPPLFLRLADVATLFLLFSFATWLVDVHPPPRIDLLLLLNVFLFALSKRSQYRRSVRGYSGPLGLYPGEPARWFPSVDLRSSRLLPPPQRIVTSGHIETGPSPCLLLLKSFFLDDESFANSCFPPLF